MPRALKCSHSKKTMAKTVSTHCAGIETYELDL